MQQIAVNLTPFISEFVLPVVAILIFVWLYLRIAAAERKNLLRAWKKLQPFEKNCLIAGFAVFVWINLPFPFMEVYTSQMLLSVTTGLGNATFAVGALAFLKSLHSVVNRNDDSGWR